MKEIRDVLKRAMEIYKRSPIFEGEFSRATIATLTLAFFISLTLAGWSIVQNLQERNENTQFDKVLAEVIRKIEHHFLGYEQVLKGGVGLLLASQSVSRKEWRTYVTALRIDDNYPGIEGIGFAKYIPPSKLAAHIEEVRAEGFPFYKVWPEDSRQEYTSVVYLEPFSGSNLRAFGYDMLSDPVRYAAMSRARDTGVAALSDKVKLIQETWEDVQAGVLMYLPYYGVANLPETLEDRRASLSGYVYARFRMDDFVRAVLQTELDNLDLRIFANKAMKEGSLLFGSRKHHSESASDTPKFKRVIPISLYGQTWTIEASSRPLFEKAIRSYEPFLILLSGIVVSFLAAMVSFILSANKEKAVALGRVNKKLVLAMVEQQATALARQEADARIRQQASLLDKATDAIMVRGIDHRIEFWNQGAERLYGWASEEVVGKSIEILYDNLLAFNEATRLLLKSGEWRGEIAQRRKDKSILLVEAHWTLVRNDNGQPQFVFAINTDITQRKAAENEILHLAFYDSLTGLPNRQLLLDRLQQALASAARRQHTGALLFIDLDNFKLLNDTLGHDLGDLLLQQVAPRLISSVRDTDTVARLGGDEFVVILAPDFSEDYDKAVEEIKTICDRIRYAFNQPFNLVAYKHHITPSIGVALFNDHTHTTDELLKQTDLAMYQAKASGRNAVCFFDPDMQAVMTARATLESDLHGSCERNEFVLHYQAQVDNGGIIGAEALVRWQHPRRGLLFPLEFIPQMEETGLILPLGEWVLKAACTQLAIWSKRPETARLNLAVNVSPRQFCQPNFVEHVISALDRTGVNPERLKLELTESIMVQNMDDTIAKMMALRTRGVGFALDDFGVGYSSLYYLKRLPLDWIKIDKSFVRDVLTDNNDATIVRAILLLAKSLGLAVMAEGVETGSQKDFLTTNGCNAYQGYLFSKPLPLEQFEEFIFIYA
ncbi:PAS domain S-box-containing protein/diguanylate cyclase (GGDEF) domain-containing protein [Nitrosospira multiformis]|uniref:PAS domain S-box-containing protein/diguanylate cyclase (GGDEF) domain-containing protein n=1 Tax=Nitrosospira multiformis TaxID=1231 RepID=A0A1H8C3T6_9PROT|nr:EAL domain-containing protein [Nitrosospira multiformis]SEM89706.1 PAS domain S-box-containing protein/diguanylate cyclase (GGDEF) domain-containing protein [Nitrosospira multiformis]